MVAEISCGIMFAGLVLGGITGSITILVSCVAAGSLTAAISEAAKRYKERINSNTQLTQYPPYGY